MGNNTSVLSSPGLYPSPIQAFQGSRAFVGPSSNNTFSSVQTRPSFKRSVRSNSPPPPPGAAAPVVPGAPRIQDNDFQTSAPFPNFNATPGSVYQSAPPQVPTPPIVKGKPRIFAAMNAAAVDEPVYVEQSAANLPQLPPQPQPSPSQSYHQQYPERQSPGRSGSGNSNMFPSQPTAPAPFDSRMPYVSPATTPDVSVTSSYNNGQQPADVLRTPRVNNPRPLPQTPDKHVQSPPRVRKLSKVRQPSDVSTMLPNASSTSIMSASVESLHSNGHGHGPKVHTHNGHRTLAKSPPIPIRPGSSHNDLVRSASRSPSKHEQQPQPQLEQVPTHVDEETIRKAGIPLDDDPFAKVEGVRMLKPTSSPSKDGSIKRHRSKEAKANGEEGLLGKEDQQSELSLQSDVPLKKAKDSKDSSSVASGQTSEERRKERRERRAREKERKAKEQEAAAAAETEAAAQNTQTASSVNGEAMELDGEIEPVHGEELEALSKLEGQKFFLFKEFLSNPQLLSYLLSFMSFYDWCLLSAVSREIRIMLVQSTPLREEVLERFLKTDLADYMRGVSTPSHEYARVAKMYVHSLTVHPTVRDSSLEHTVRRLTASTRAYTRVVLRLRAQAEKEASVASANPQRSQSTTSPPPSAANAAKAVNGYSNGYGNGHGAPSRSTSRPSSRAPSPTMSNYSHSHSQFSHSNSGTIHQNSSQTSLAFRSPLFRLRRAPLLRVFVPSPEGDWLSDKSVLDCEAECKKAGVLHLMRMGDVIWDIAAGDEGNVGRLVYDGKYLIDLDYTYNPIGDLPKYIHTLAFPPSYFHRVIRTGPVTSNPVAHIDISPWGEEIAANLQLLQDRVKTETPQGAYHNVVRWVHRSSFVIRPPARVMQRGQSINGRSQPHTPRIPIPETENLFIDPGWYGTIVVETEGTNETLADLQARCGPRAFPPRPKPLNPVVAKAAEENRKVFRILREKSRPGEIWIKAVSVKERIL
ncbi:hypothetical protein FA15DRAFT_681011 [Coprinopsis marcescibilis]|uniref:F-box domain-containing protein n=1 Tax=Coprinopsis marcescibilis TaxID=230819 RepID=A0A5C3L6L1_COPMA|nr:hypothetical protein FA15DRAFT_681011 [Coprinopsis marcescibilis]